MKSTLYLSWPVIFCRCGNETHVQHGGSSQVPVRTRNVFQSHDTLIKGSCARACKGEGVSVACRVTLRPNSKLLGCGNHTSRVRTLRPMARGPITGRGLSWAQTQRLFGACCSESRYQHQRSMQWLWEGSKIAFSVAEAITMQTEGKEECCRGQEASNSHDQAASQPPLACTAS